MSKRYREVFNKELPPSVHPDLAAFCQIAGAEGPDGLPEYTTEQNHMKECDINEIVRKYDKTGVIDHVTKFEGDFGDVTGLEFRSALDLVRRSEESFMQLPAVIRARFDNTPEKLLSFMENSANREEAITLGLISREFPANLDGMGEHVKATDAIKRDEDIKNSTK